MGIKGIFGEIGPGQRIALSKLAVETYERLGRPLRVAVDISIWQFQIQSGQGGTNPALRTLYYRLVRLLSLSIQPLFIFDGPNKPPFKRNVRTIPNAASLPNLRAKELLKLFGFPYRTAPGEAEAECAILQKDGVVDAVLSEDVDTLMFGCGLSLRNWSSEGTRGNKSPTHVNLYDAIEIRNGKWNLDRDGMVLVALMSGGDYIPAGIPGCGIKVACEAAKAGFGRELCKIPRGDSTSLRQWRERLGDELRTNESRFFRVRHKSLKIPDSFPDRTVLGYYTHPAISSPETIQRLKAELNWEDSVNVQGLRRFVAEAFEWSHKAGARKFIRGLAPALLVSKLKARANGAEAGSDDLGDIQEQEERLVKVICGRRSHFDTDGTPELRVGFIPADIVGLDLNQEESDDDHEKVGSASEAESLVAEVDGGIRDVPSSPRKTRPVAVYDPKQLEKLYVLETYVKLGIPLMVEDWEETMRNPKKGLVLKATTKKMIPKEGDNGTLDGFFRVSKPAGSSQGAERGDCLHFPQSIEAYEDNTRAMMPPASRRPPKSKTNTRATASKGQPSTRRTRQDTSTTASKTRKPTEVTRPEINTRNPWTLSQRSSNAHDEPSHRPPPSPSKFSGGINTAIPALDDDRTEHSSPTSRKCLRRRSSRSRSRSLSDVQTSQRSPSRDQVHHQHLSPRRRCSSNTPTPSTANTTNTRASQAPQLRSPTRTLQRARPRPVVSDAIVLSSDCEEAAEDAEIETAHRNHDSQRSGPEPEPQIYTSSSRREPDLDIPSSPSSLLSSSPLSSPPPTSQSEAHEEGEENEEEEEVPLPLPPSNNTRKHPSTSRSQQTHPPANIVLSSSPVPDEKPAPPPSGNQVARLTTTTRTVTLRKSMEGWWKYVEVDVDVDVDVDGSGDGNGNGSGCARDGDSRPAGPDVVGGKTGRLGKKTTVFTAVETLDLTGCSRD
ncbi:MAG: hypothetical protein M1819_001363 [Sarea resinae]|nr:MAG: hypothetical protein M1819_001363 [Sarea resinae]